MNMMASTEELRMLIKSISEEIAGLATDGFHWGNPYTFEAYAQQARRSSGQIISHANRIGELAALIDRTLKQPTHATARS